MFWFVPAFSAVTGNAEGKCWSLLSAPFHLGISDNTWYYVAVNLDKGVFRVTTTTDVLCFVFVGGIIIGLGSFFNFVINFGRIGYKRRHKPCRPCLLLALWLRALSQPFSLGLPRLLFYR